MGVGGAHQGLHGINEHHLIVGDVAQLLLRCEVLVLHLSVLVVALLMVHLMLLVLGAVVLHLRGDLLARRVVHHFRVVLCC